MMPTYDALPPHLQIVATEMANAAREAMRERGFKPDNSDDAARFDEACAVFLTKAYNYADAAAHNTAS